MGFGYDARFVFKPRLYDGFYDAKGKQRRGIARAWKFHERFISTARVSLSRAGKNWVRFAKASKRIISINAEPVKNEMTLLELLSLSLSLSLENEKYLLRFSFDS